MDSYFCSGSGKRDKLQVLKTIDNAPDKEGLLIDRKVYQ